MSFFWLLFICVYKVTFVSSQTQIIQDFMTNTDAWTVRSFDAYPTQSGNCQNGGRCIALTQYAIIYRTFPQTASYKSITLSFYLLLNDEVGCAGGTNDRCDVFYAFYSCQSRLYLIEIFGADDVATTSANGVTNYALSSECDNKEVTIYFYSNTEDDDTEIVYVDNIRLFGILDTNINTITQYDEIVYTQLTSTNEISILNGNVNIRSDGRYCIPGNCLEMSQTSEISIKYDISGYHNILLYWDINVCYIIHCKYITYTFIYNI